MDCFATLAKTGMEPICQHDTPSLRGALATQQFILSLCGGMDCFAALEMTGRGPICQHDTPSLRGALATKQSILSLVRRDGLLRSARNEGEGAYPAPSSGRTSSRPQGESE